MDAKRTTYHYESVSITNGRCKGPVRFLHFRAMSKSESKLQTMLKLIPVFPNVPLECTTFLYQLVMQIENA